ncbi:hypothetical protein C5167_047504 [Papaver somniferum]|uniref:Alpha/beta hydrolase fold-3 domain-containing protein n=1 Tax=Papaver somniferum TaxID=3469 RepID=A0A4Y7LJS4_PAPSO|nr:hypothetical protein C5167_047504 [Papaver somniferum]
MADPYEFLMCIHNPEEDTLTRNFPIPATPLDQNTKDISLNPDRKTSLRIFRPPTKEPPVTKNKLLPIIIYFHGGGFILFNADSTMNHDFCQSIATHIPALVVSVDYRLAPENRLPAAYDDAVDALNWVKDQGLGKLNNSEVWLKEYGDFSKCFIMGCSSGANVAYHASLRAIEMDLEPAKINGLILHCPFFGSLERTESDSKVINNQDLPLAVRDVMWELALPLGSTRDHVYCNPNIDHDGSSSGNMVGLIERCFVVGFYGDPLIDRQIQLVKMLEEKGVKVETWIEQGGILNCLAQLYAKDITVDDNHELYVPLQREREDWDSVIEVVGSLVTLTVALEPGFDYC